MVKLTTDLVNQAIQYVNPLRERELLLRGKLFCFVNIKLFIYIFVTLYLYCFVQLKAVLIVSCCHVLLTQINNHFMFYFPYIFILLQLRR